MKDTVLYIVNGVLLTITFGVFRLLIWVYLVHIYAEFRSVTLTAAFQLLPKYCSLGTVGLIIMNAYWFSRILYKFIHNVSKLCSNAKFPKSAIDDKKLM